MKTTASNGVELVIGKKYKRKGWTEDDFIEVLDIGILMMWCKNSSGNKTTFEIDTNWLPYEDPQTKPFEKYQKYFICLDREVIKIEYMTTEKAEELKSKSHIGGVYTESEIIELGLKL
jgi:hypothetical protein